MKNKKILCIILATIMLVSLVGCQKKEEDITPNIPPEGPVVDDPSYDKVEEENYDFINKGNSDYKIVIPAKANNNEEKAVSELNYFLQLSVGISLPVIKDNTVEVDNSQKYISIGRTAFFDESNIKVKDDILKTSGYMLKTIDKTLYLLGSNYGDLGYGVIYAVYGFLEKMIDLRIYTVDCFKYDKPTTITMKKFDTLEIPDYDYRFISTPRSDELYYMRIRNASGIPNPFGTVHTHHVIIPYSKYGKDHPDWFNPKGGQLRLVSEEMTAEFIEVCKNKIRDDPNLHKLFFGINDLHDPLSSEDLKYVKQKYNTDESGMNIIFCNKVVNAIEEWLPTEFPGRVMQYETLIYFEHTPAPVTFNTATGKYEPHSKYVIPHEKLILQIAFMAMPNWGESLLSPANASMYDTVKGWASICHNFSVYGYGINYHAYLVNFMDYNSYETNVRLGYEEFGFNGYYQLLGSNSASPAFEEMRIFVESELLWDTSKKFKDLAKEFIDAYYGDASSQVWEYFMLTCNNLAIQDVENKMSQGHTTGYLWQAKFWPFELLQKMSKILNEGEEKYEYLKDIDTKQYEVMLNRIRQQKFTVQYLQMLNYITFFNKTEIEKTLNELEQTAQKNGFVRAEERDEYNTPINNIKQWRIKYL